MSIDFGYPNLDYLPLQSEITQIKTARILRKMRQHGVRQRKDTHKKIQEFLAH